MRYLPCDAMRIADGAEVADRLTRFHIAASRCGPAPRRSFRYNRLTRATSHHPPHTYLLHRRPRWCPLCPILPRFKQNCKRQGQRPSSTAGDRPQDSDVGEWSPQSNGRKESGARQSRVRDRSAKDREADNVPRHASCLLVNRDLNPDDNNVRRPSERRQSESRQEMPSK